jgi:hypothetical protein
MMDKESNDHLAIFLNEEISSFMRLEFHIISLLDSKKFEIRVSFEY